MDECESIECWSRHFREWTTDLSLVMIVVVVIIIVIVVNAVTVLCFLCQNVATITFLSQQQKTLGDVYDAFA